MPNLLDTLRANTMSAVQPQDQTDETQKLADLLRAKSGRAVAAPEIGMSNLGEQSAVDQTNTQLKNEVAPQAAIQSAGQELQGASQEQQIGQTKAEIGQGRAFNTLQNKLQTTALLNQFKQNQGTLKLQEDQAGVQQFAQGLRLQNANYIDQLQMEGDKSRLMDQNAFNQEVAQTTFGDNLDVLKQQLGDRSVLDASDRDFRVAISNMTMDEARQIFQNERKAAQARAPYQAIGSMAQTGVGAAAAASNKSDSGANPAGPSPASYEDLG